MLKKQDVSGQHRSARQAGSSSVSEWSRMAPYALVCLVSFICGVLILIVLIGNADKLSALGLTGNLYYIVLLPLALCVAGFLFGVLRSYARYRGKHLNGVLELGGPIIASLL